MRHAAQASDFRELLLSQFEDLPAQQQAAASFFLDHLKDVPFLSVPELARRARVSEATIVRLAQRLGYSGFSDLKADLLEALREGLAGNTDLEGEVPSLDDGSELETLIVVARQEITNIQRTVEGLSQDAFDAVTSALFKADHVYSFGLGISAQFAELMTYLLSQIGLRSTRLSSQFSSPLEQLVTLRASDLLVVFSFPPYSRSTIELVRLAGERGVTTVAVSDRPSAPVARVARHVLTAQTENLMFTNSFAAISVLLNALTTGVSLQHRAHVADAVTQINRLLEGDDRLIQP